MSTSFSLKRLKLADKSFKYRVFGYLHEYELNKSINIPIMIKYICFNYYLLTEEFTKHSNLNIVNEPRNKIQAQYSRITVYGTLPIGDSDESIIEYRWKFKMRQADSWIGIGIDSSDKEYMDTDFSASNINTSKFHCVVFNPQTAYYFDNDKANHPVGINEEFDLEKNGNVDMILNMHEKTLRFKVDDLILSPHFSMNIDFDMKIYHMAVCLADLDSVQLLGFEIKHT